jgi:4-diphosphocytidyl-2-C-methyl-D-erythritol kinase
MDADLTVRAARLLQQTTGSPGGATIRIVKRLPLGGGWAAAVPTPPRPWSP